MKGVIVKENGDPVSDIDLGVYTEEMSIRAILDLEL
jgi:hypothetical protein